MFGCINIIQKLKMNIKNTGNIAQESKVNLKNPRKKFKVPDTYVLVFVFVIIAAILTYILPAGEYNLIKDPGTGRSLVDPASFHFVERNPASLMDVLLSIPKGMKNAGWVIFLIFIIGGAFKIIDDTGAMKVSIEALVEKFEGKVYIIIPVIMAAMSVLGALGIVVVSAIAFIPLGIHVSKKLKLDPVVAVAIMYVGAYAGFVTSPFIPATLQLAQNIAGLEPLSGMGLRVVVWLLVTIVSILYTIRYAKKLENNIDNSVLDKIEWTNDKDSGDTVKLNWTHISILMVVIICFAVYAYGALNWSWGSDHMGAMLILAALLSAVISRMHPDKVAQSFIAGCKDMIFGTMIIGFAGAISVVLSEGKIIHTIIYGFSLPLKGLPSVLSANCMLLVNSIFNFFVSSGSGQAAIVMPLMAPMADIVGITRQVSVLAYQWGDGFSNTIIPTSGVLMAVLAVAKIRFEKWLKFMIPLFLIWMLIGFIAVTVAVMTGYN
ncbi:TIGR00366 family protein [uncultured Ilyobacter sp.]|uniref:YfcC family protein n=1 Tax=uncultured Ilyobacter sp. TaxID=544433 RepID=UPI0029F5909E|nr:TIGR00366 family protein [uncultured Ilyobacter sp.]